MGIGVVVGALLALLIPRLCFKRARKGGAAAGLRTDGPQWTVGGGPSTSDNWVELNEAAAQAQKQSVPAA